MTTTHRDAELRRALGRLCWAYRLRLRLHAALMECESSAEIETMDAALMAHCSRFTPHERNAWVDLVTPLVQRERDAGRRAA